MTTPAIPCLYRHMMICSWQVHIHTINWLSQFYATHEATLTFIIYLNFSVYNIRCCNICFACWENELNWQQHWLLTLECSHHFSCHFLADTTNVTMTIIYKNLGSLWNQFCHMYFFFFKQFERILEHKNTEGIHWLSFRLTYIL